MATLLVIGNPVLWYWAAKSILLSGSRSDRTNQCNYISGKRKDNIPKNALEGCLDRGWGDRVESFCIQKHANKYQSNNEVNNGVKLV